MQVKDFFDVKDDPVLGFSPPAVVTVFHTHVWEGTIDYRFVVVEVCHTRHPSIVFVWLLLGAFSIRPKIPKPVDTGQVGRKFPGRVSLKSENC